MDASATICKMPDKTEICLEFLEQVCNSLQIPEEIQKKTTSLFLVCKGSVYVLLASLLLMCKLSGSNITFDDICTYVIEIADEIEELKDTCIKFDSIQSKIADGELMILNKYYREMCAIYSG